MKTSDERYDPKEPKIRSESDPNTKNFGSDRIRGGLPPKFRIRIGFVVGKIMKIGFGSDS